MSANEMIRIGAPLPRIATAEAGHGLYEMIVTWEAGMRAGERDVLDLAPMVLTHKTLAPLRDDRALFATVRASEHGEGIEWGNDDAIAMAATTLQRLAEERMTNEDFAASP